jgi:signal transduction histidine kinase
LSGWFGHSLFIATILLTAVSLWGSLSAALPALVVMLSLVAVFMLFGTIGWNQVLKRHSARLVYQYFLAQYVLVTLLMFAEMRMGTQGLSTSILGIGVTFQSCVLPVRSRLWLFSGLLVLVVLLYTPTMPTGFDIQQSVTNVMLFAAIYSVGIFVGTLILREERARETSLRLDESNRKLAHYIAEVEALSTVRERNRLAREIHDTIGHYLTAVNMQLEVAMMALSPEEDSTQAALIKAQTLTKEALSEIRRSISALRATPIENRTLGEALALLVEEHRAAGNTVSFQIIGAVRPCSESVEMAFYRITQEALTNVRKHAAGSSANVTLSYLESGSISLEVQDDGRGTEHYDDGFGLVGIRERVQSFGGTLTIVTEKGGGFMLRVVISS